MSSADRQLYLSATVLNQAFLDATAQDNLDARIELIVDIQTSSGYIRASDRNKYVGNVFYEALLVFPVITRKISHWLQNQIEFSSLSLELSNVDQRFNHFELGGANYSGFIGKSIVVSVGLRDVASTYTQIFLGVVTEVGGFGRTTKSLTFTARDSFDKVAKDLPLSALTIASFPHIETDKVGLAVPVIYGDWTTAMQKDPLGVQTASVLVFCVNGIFALANPLQNAQFIISENANSSFDTAHVYIKRSGYFTVFNAADIQNVNGARNYFEIVQNGVTTIPPPPGLDGSGAGVGGSEPWIYANGDEIFCRVVGKALPGGLNTNAVLQAQDILVTYGGFNLTTDFDSSWASYAAKTSPAQSAVANIPARLWVQEVQTAMQFSISLLAQVRLEIFVNRQEKLQLISNHFEDWIPSPAYKVRNWDVVKDTFKPALDSQNNFNRARALYDRQPAKGETSFASGFYSNAAAIAQEGKQITKEITFPNLYVASDVQNQLIEILRLASAQSELISVTLTSRSLLLELGSWVSVNVQIGSVVFSGVPAQVREVGYDPAGLKIPVVLWSMQAVPFPGYMPGYAGTVGGFNATITAE